MTSIASFKSTSTKQDVHLENYGPIYSKIEYAVQRRYLEITSLRSQYDPIRIEA